MLQEEQNLWFGVSVDCQELKSFRQNCQIEENESVFKPVWSYCSGPPVLCSDFRSFLYHFVLLPFVRLLLKKSATLFLVQQQNHMMWNKTNKKKNKCLIHKLKKKKKKKKGIISAAAAYPSDRGWRAGLLFSVFFIDLEHIPPTVYPVVLLIGAQSTDVLCDCVFTRNTISINGYN